VFGRRADECASLEGRQELAQQAAQNIEFEGGLRSSPKENLKISEESPPGLQPYSC
jgi:hypothetical protein